jgi:hypothetical protein
MEASSTGATLNLSIKLESGRVVDIRDVKSSSVSAERGKSSQYFFKLNSGEEFEITRKDLDCYNQFRSEIQILSLVNPKNRKKYQVITLKGVGGRELRKEITRQRKEQTGS